MPDNEARLDRSDQNIQALASVTGEMARELRALVQALAADRAAFRETLREMSGYVATASLGMDRLERQVQRLAETTEAGFAQAQILAGENNRLIVEVHRRMDETNRRMDENTAAIRRLIEILARGRGDGQGQPA